MKRMFHLLLLLPGLALAAAPELPVIRWQKLPDLPSPGGGHLVLEDRGNLLVLGGTFWQNGVKCWHDRVLRLDAAGNRWIEADKLPLPLGYMAGCVHDGKIILSGGATVGGESNPRTYIGTGDGRWTIACPTGGPPFGAATATDGKRMFACGGLLRSDDWTTATNQLLVMDLDHPERGWQTGPPLPGTGRALAAMCVRRGQLYLFGGADDKIENLPECWTMALPDGPWTRLSDMPVAVRYALALPWEDKIILIANCLTGPDGKTVTTDRIFCFDPETGRWNSAGAAPYCAAADGMISGDRINLAGGEDKGMSRVASCFRGIIAKKSAAGTEPAMESDQTESRKP